MTTAQAIHPPLLMADLFRLLARVFGPPEGRTSGELNEFCADLSQDLAGTDHFLSQPVSLLCEALEQTPAETVESDYEPLFLTHVLVSPFEGSYHRQERGPVMGDVAAFYTAFGLQTHEQSGPVDALHQELAFMSYLCLKLAYAQQNSQEEAVTVCRDAGKLFLGDHLARWTGAFYDRLVHATDNPVWVRSAELLVGVVDQAAVFFEVGEVVPLAWNAPVKEDDGEVNCPMGGGGEGETSL